LGEAIGKPYLKWGSISDKMLKNTLQVVSSLAIYRMVRSSKGFSISSAITVAISLLYNKDHQVKLNDYSQNAFCYSQNTQLLLNQY